MNEIKEYTENIFEIIMHIDEEGNLVSKRINAIA